MAVPDDYKELDELDPIEMVSNADGAELHSRTGSAQFRAMDGNNPQAWPERQKLLNLSLVGFHTMTTTLTAASIIPAFEPLSEDFGQSIQRISYFVAAHILVLGLAPLFWRPVSHRLGHRPVWLISTAGAGLFNVGCALSPSYGWLMFCRVMNAFFISPPMAIGAAVVVAMFEPSQRGQKMGIWTLMVTLGPLVGPLIFGFVAFNLGWVWILWILAIINFAQFALYFKYGSETYCIKEAFRAKFASDKKALGFPRLDPSPITFSEIIAPLGTGKHLNVLIPAVAYAITFGFGAVLLTVEIPQTYVPTFGLNPQQLGLNFIALIIGSVLGEQGGGPLGDWWMRQGAARMGHKPASEYRLWLAYPGFLITMVGLVMFGVQLDRTVEKQWNVWPDIGAAIASFGNQLITTVLVTYAIDSHPEQSASVSSFISVVRQTWGFIGPFWFPDMFSAFGFAGSGYLMAFLIGIGSCVPTAFLQLQAQSRTGHGDNAA